MRYIKVKHNHRRRKKIVLNKKIEFVTQSLNYIDLMKNSPKTPLECLTKSTTPNDNYYWTLAMSKINKP